MNPKTGKNPSNKSLRFLIVDDQVGTRSLVKAVLSQGGYTNVRSCGNGLEALTELQAGDVDIVVCDWNMPRMNGIELLRQMRKNNATNAIPFVMLTAQQEQNEVVMAVAYGATDYIIKPFTSETLMGKIERIIRKHFS
jgi:two-component system chemotaxis response regulator CheY